MPRLIRTISFTPFWLTSIWTNLRFCLIFHAPFRGGSPQVPSHPFLYGSWTHRAFPWSCLEIWNVRTDQMQPLIKSVLQSAHQEFKYGAWTVWFPMASICVLVGVGTEDKFDRGKKTLVWVLALSQPWSNRRVILAQLVRSSRFSLSNMLIEIICTCVYL
jgi:hypothetical protein